MVLVPEVKSLEDIVTVSVTVRRPRASVTVLEPSWPVTVLPVTLRAPPARVAVAEGTLSERPLPVRVNVTGVVPLVAAFAVAGTKAARPAIVAAVMPRAMVLRIVPPVTGPPSWGGWRLLPEDYIGLV